MAELKPCPFCGGEAIMHYGEFSSKFCQYKKEIPKDARFVRSMKYPAGNISYEYREKRSFQSVWTRNVWGEPPDSLNPKRKQSKHGTGGRKMWQISDLCYSEKTKLKMLKSASAEKLMEYLLMVTRRKEK